MKLRFSKLLGEILCLLCILIASKSADAGSQPHFGQPIIVLDGAKAVGDAYAGAGGLATVLDGRYVIGLSWGVDVQGDARIFLWDTNQAQGSHTPVHLTPSLELSYKPGRHLLYAVSPDEHYVALSMASEWRLLMLPTFKVYKSLPVNVPNTGEQIRWSADGRLLAILNKDRSILVWDIATDKVYRNDAKLVGSLRHIPDGWMILARSEDEPYRFAACSLLVEHCRAYSSDTLKGDVAVSPDGSTVYVPTDQLSKIDEVWRWQRQADGSYQMDNTPTLIRASVQAIRFSPSGRYFATDNFIWDSATQTPLQPFTLSAWDVPVWLPNEDYFLVYYHDLYLHKLGQIRPLDRFVRASVGIDDNSELIIAEFAGIDDISRDGKKVILQLGQIALVVPIEY